MSSDLECSLAVSGLMTWINHNRENRSSICTYAGVCQGNYFCLFVVIRICCVHRSCVASDSSDTCFWLLSWKPEAAQTTEDGGEGDWDRKVDAKEIICMTATLYTSQNQFIRFVTSHVPTGDVLPHPPPPSSSSMSFPCSLLQMHLILMKPNLVFCLCFYFISPLSPKATAEAAAAFIWVKQALW